MSGAAITKTPLQLDREIDERELADFVRGADKYSPLKRARRAYGVATILRERGVETAGADDNALVALARVELDRPAAPTRATAPVVLGRGEITEQLARDLPRFDFIAHWLAVVTRKKANRGPLGLYVKRVGKQWQIVSPVGGGTVTYKTNDTSLLFDYARRGQLGSEIRNAEEFRGQAFASASR